MDLVNESPRVLGNRYEVGDLLGRGGMAEVHLGRDTRLGRTVAIKLLRIDLARDAVFQARFRREAQSAAALNHPAIVAVYDTGEEAITDHTGTVVALPFIVMEFVEGRTLRELLDGRPIEAGQALDVTAGVLSALEYSHRSGIVHRDIKPGNVMVTPTGDIKVMDFGIARALADASATMTQTQAVIGTAQYLSPEQARGETVDARSDLYSAGCLLFELLTGRPPFVADSPVAVAYQHVRENPRPPSTYNPSVPEVVDRVVLHSLAKDREARYQTAAEFRADVEAARAGRRVSAMAPSGMDPNAAATEYMPSAQAAAGTRAMPPVPGGYYGQGGAAGGAAGAGMLPGAPNPATDYDQGYGGGRRDQRQQEKRGNKTGGYVLLVLGVLAVFGLVAFIFYNVLGTGDKTATGTMVSVPRVVGLPLGQAEDAITKAGLVFTRGPDATDENIAKGSVKSVNPAENASVAKGSSVTLTVSAGSAKGSIPDVTNRSQDDATKALTDQGFTVGTITTADNRDVKQGYVISSDPPVGPAPKGTAVNLVISTGKVTVQNVIGKSIVDARSILKGQLGLTVVEQGVSSDKPAGTVVDQNPASGSVAQKSTIQLQVSTGPSTPPTTQTSPPPTSITPTPPTSSVTIP
jgi:serine/threonine-protein kinase